jgi:hypothetical protein
LPVIETSILPTKVVKAADRGRSPSELCGVGHQCLRRLEAELGEETQSAFERAQVGVGVLARV